MNRQPIHSGSYQSSNYGNNLAYCYNCEEIIQVTNDITCPMCNLGFIEIGTNTQPQAPEESPDLPNSPNSPDLSDSTDSLNIPGLPELSFLPESPDFSDLLDLPYSPESPDLSDIPDTPDSPDNIELPASSNVISNPRSLSTNLSEVEAFRALSITPIPARNTRQIDASLPTRYYQQRGGNLLMGAAVADFIGSILRINLVHSETADNVIEIQNVHDLFDDLLTNPLSMNEIKELPTTIISQENLDNDPQCSICLENFIIGEKVMKLFCSHRFHEQCITPWLLKSNTCPLCRKTLPGGNRSIILLEGNHRRSSH